MIENMPGKEKSEIHYNIKVNLQMDLNCDVFKAEKHENIHEDLSTNFATNSTYFLQGTKNQRREKYMSYFAYACKTEGQNGIFRLISALCVNCLSSIPEYSRLNHLDEYLV